MAKRRRPAKNLVPMLDQGFREVAVSKAPRRAVQRQVFADV
jgi:hypothetical protein